MLSKAEAVAERKRFFKIPLLLFHRHQKTKIIGHNFEWNTSE